jgi:hypothetical protein
MTWHDRVIRLLLPAIDYALFLVTSIGGAPLVWAHVGAFALASAPSFPFVTRDPPATGAQHLGGFRLNAQLIRIFVIAMSSRVVLLWLFSQPLGWTPVLAVIPAILISHLVLRNGAALFAAAPMRGCSDR